MNSKKMTGYISRCLTQLRQRNVNTLEQGVKIKDYSIFQLEVICNHFKELQTVQFQIQLQRQNSGQKHRRLQQKYQACRNQIENIIHRHHIETIQNLTLFLQSIRQMKENFKSVEVIRLEQRSIFEDYENIFGEILQRQTKQDENLSRIIRINNEFFQRITQSASTYLKNHDHLIKQFKEMLFHLQNKLVPTFGVMNEECQQVKKEINELQRNDHF